MAKITNIKRIIKEDFEKDDQNLIDRLAFSLNPFMEQVVALSNKGVDYDNLNRELVFLETEVDANGTPKINSELRTILKTPIKGLAVLSAQSLSGNTFPTSAPFISFTKNNNIITILNITGLPANTRFRLTIDIIG